jgi:hypothetical protein
MTLSLRSLLPKLLGSGTFAVLSLTLTVVPAQAASPAPPGSTGYDISWPQCPSNFPSGGTFGIVGVTNGLAFSANPCLSAEYAWATTSPRIYAAGLYINTGNPEKASSNWPGRAGVGPRTCSTTDLNDPSNVNCAYNYGWNAATDALNVATTNVGAAAQTLPWWLDVEIGNSWNGIGGANSSTIQGYIDYQRGHSTGMVGIYSTGSQWGQITGGYTVPSAPDWLAGASNVTDARNLCNNPASSFSGGPVQLVQYPNGNFDGNYVCGVAPPPPPDYTLSATPSSRTVVQGAGTNYTVNIAPTGGFTGSVTLSVSGLPSGAAATFSPNPAPGTSSGMSVTTSATTPAGSYTPTITGVSGSLTHTTSITLVIQAASTPDYSLSAAPSSSTVVQGAGTSYTVNITPTGGFTGSVTLSVSALPTGANANFSPNPTATSSTMSVTTSTSTPAGSYPLTITGFSGSLTHTTSVTLVVQAAAAPGYSLSANPSSRSIVQGARTTYTVTITRTGGFTGSVALSASGLPSGVTASFSPTSTTGTSSTLSVTSSARTQTGSYTLTITGVSGTLTRTITVTLVITTSHGCNNNC